MSATCMHRGASAFKGKNHVTGALAAMLATTRAGRILAGTELIVENTDRTGHQAPGEAMGAVRELGDRRIINVTADWHACCCDRPARDAGAGFILDAVVRSVHPGTD